MFLVVIQDKRPRRRDEPPLSDGAWEVVQRCWARETEKRPRMKDVVEGLSTNAGMPPLPATSTSSTTSVRRPRFLLRIVY